MPQTNPNRRICQAFSHGRSQFGTRPVSPNSCRQPDTTKCPDSLSQDIENRTCLSDASSTSPAFPPPVRFRPVRTIHYPGRRRIGWAPLADLVAFLAPRTTHRTLLWNLAHDRVPTNAANRDRRPGRSAVQQICGADFTVGACRGLPSGPRAWDWRRLVFVCLSVFFLRTFPR